MNDRAEAQKLACDLGWKLFELNANQRMTMIRFYLIAIGGIASGVGYLWQASLAGAGLSLCMLGVVTSWCFLRLDLRTSDLVKLGELAVQRALMTDPSRGVPDPFELGSQLEHHSDQFAKEMCGSFPIARELASHARRRHYPYTYDDNMCVLLCAVILAFFLAGGFCGWKLLPPTVISQIQEQIGWR